MELNQKEQKAFETIYKRWMADKPDQIKDGQIYNRCMALALKEVLVEYKTLRNQRCIECEHKLENYVKICFKCYSEYQTENVIPQTSGIDLMGEALENTIRLEKINILKAIREIESTSEYWSASQKEIFKLIKDKIGEE